MAKCLSRTLSRALNMTVATVIAEQAQPIRTTVEQPFLFETHCQGQGQEGLKVLVKRKVTGEPIL